jgi:membrane associated rhomboid family serine protease
LKVANVTHTATFWIAVFTALVSIFTGLGTLGVHAPLTLGFVPARASGLDFPFAAIPVFLTPLTATLVHGGTLHLGFNLLMLVWCGLAVERVLGTGALIFLYVVSAYLAMVAQWATDPAGIGPVIGASGAISGLIGAYALSFGRPRLVTRNMKLNRWIHIAWLATAWTVLQVIVGWSAGQQGMLLATPAHVGGFVAGLLLQRPLLLWRYRRA